MTIALFGTCDNSKWRDRFVAKYDELGIKYYNPVVPNWTPENAIAEAYHLQTDAIILFPVTYESFGFGSLAEIGFAALSVTTSETPRHLIVYIAERVGSTIERDEPKLADLSRRARALVKAHLDKRVAVGSERIHVVDDLLEMLDKSIELHNSLALGA